MPDPLEQSHNPNEEIITDARADELLAQQGTDSFTPDTAIQLIHYFRKAENQGDPEGFVRRAEAIQDPSFAAKILADAASRTGEISFAEAALGRLDSVTERTAGQEDLRTRVALMRTDLLLGNEPDRLDDYRKGPDVAAGIVPRSMPEQIVFRQPVEEAPTRIPSQRGEQIVFRTPTPNARAKTDKPVELVVVDSAAAKAEIHGRFKTARIAADQITNSAAQARAHARIDRALADKARDAIDIRGRIKEARRLVEQIRDEALRDKVAQDLGI